MKRFVALVLQGAAILAFTGSSLGDDGEGVELRQACPVTLDEGELMHKTIFKMGRNCLETTGTDATLVLYHKTLDEHKEFFKSYCGKQPQILGCLADVARTSQSCQNQTRHQTYQVFRELLETTLEAGCVQDGQVIADIFMIFFRNNSSAPETNAFHDCLAINDVKFSHAIHSDISDFSINYIFYRDIMLTRDCFNHVSEGDQLIKNRIVSLLGVIVENYKCFDPQDDSVVLCKSLHPEHDVSNGTCPIKSEDEQTKPLYNIFINQIPILLSVIDSREYKGLAHFENREQCGIFFKSLCDKKNLIQIVFKDASELASSCLDRAHNLMFQTAVNLIENVLGQICLGDGRYLTDVMFKTFSDVGNSTDINAVKKCKDIVLPENERIGVNFTSEKTLEVYKKLKVFKECFVNELQGDDVVVSSAELILNGVINNMKCPDPEQTSLVLCETIANTV